MRNIVFVCVVWTLSFPAWAVTLKIATVAPDGTSWMTEMRKGADEIAQRTANRVTFRFFPGGVMGNDKSVLRKIRVGQLQGGAIVSGGLTEIDPDIALYNLPFAFNSLDEVDHVRKRMDATLVKSMEDHGFVTFGLSEGGFAYLLSKKPVHSFTDLKGQKAWAPDDDRISRAAFEAINVPPVPLPITDVLTGLQTGLLDTVAASPLGAIALQWHAQVKHMMDEPLMYIYASLIIDRKAFDRLSPEDQAVVREVMGRIFTKLDQQNRADNEKARRTLQSQGITFNAPTAEMKNKESEIKQDIERLILKQNLLSPELVRTMRQHLDEYRRARTTAK